MIRPPDFVLSRLAVGGEVVTPETAKYLFSAGITHIVNCAWDTDDGPMLSKTSMVCLCNATGDEGKPQPAEWFGRTLAFVLPVLAQPHSKVYIHCREGINRGPSACYAVLRALGHTPAAAESLIRTARPNVGLAYMRDADAAVLALGYV